MSKVNIQKAVEEYHLMMSGMGMDMHEFHANWHQNNRDPQYPDAPDPNWGTDNSFGENFLQMHHEMVKADENEPKKFMDQSIVNWFQSQGYQLPGEWDPLTPIPLELAFNPIDPSLMRKTENPQFELPNYFTLKGIKDDEQPEPITRARKLADFKNINQLGCCIVYPHNIWHNAIGGAMLYFNTAIDDPIFYFGVHWEIDKIFDLYKTLPHLFDLFDRNVPKEFTQEELEQLKTAEEIGLKIRR